MAHVDTLNTSGKLRGPGEPADRISIRADLLPDGGDTEIALLFVNDPPMALYEQAQALAIAAGRMLAIAAQVQRSGRWDDEVTYHECRSCGAEGHHHTPVPESHACGTADEWLCADCILNGQVLTALGNLHHAAGATDPSLEKAPF